VRQARRLRILRSSGSAIAAEPLMTMRVKSGYFLDAAAPPEYDYSLWTS
jgi:hypothetical protein